MNDNERLLLAVALISAGIALSFKTVWFTIFLLVLALIFFVLITIEVGGKGITLQHKTKQGLVALAVLFGPTTLITLLGSFAGEPPYVTTMEVVIGIIMIVIGTYYGSAAFVEAQYLEAFKTDIAHIYATTTSSFSADKAAAAAAAPDHEGFGSSSPAQDTPAAEDTTPVEGEVVDETPVNTDVIPVVEGTIRLGGNG